jgi:hypothetical protein
MSDEQKDAVPEDNRPEDECRRCHVTMHLADGDDPEELCHSCAYAEIAALEQSLRERDQTIAELQNKLESSGNDEFEKYVTAEYGWNDFRRDGPGYMNCEIDIAWDMWRTAIANYQTWGVVEIAIRNPNVASYCEHWEGRTTKAEAENQKLRELVQRYLRDHICQTVSSSVPLCMTCLDAERQLSSRIADATGVIDVQDEAAKPEWNTVGQWFGFVANGGTTWISCPVGKPCQHTAPSGLEAESPSLPTFRFLRDGSTYWMCTCGKLSIDGIEACRSEECGAGEESILSDKDLCPDCMHGNPYIYYYRRPEYLRMWF